MGRGSKAAPAGGRRLTAVHGIWPFAQRWGPSPRGDELNTTHFGWGLASICFAQAVAWPGIAQVISPFRRVGAPEISQGKVTLRYEEAVVVCRLDDKARARDCAVESGGASLNADQRAALLSEPEGEAFYSGPPIVLPGPPGPTPALPNGKAADDPGPKDVPPSFVASGPQDRVEYSGPPVIVPAPPPPPPLPRDSSRIVTNPQWLKRPTVADLERFYPPRALAAEVGGRAIIECWVTGQGTLTDCVAISETPAGMGFGEATVQIAAKFRMRPRTADGRTVEGARIRLPITWKLDAPVEETSPPGQ